MPSRDGALSTLAVPSSLEGSTLLKHDLFVGGEWVPASDGARFDVHDPATGQPIARVASRDVRRRRTRNRRGRRGLPRVGGAACAAARDDPARAGTT